MELCENVGRLQNLIYIKIFYNSLHAVFKYFRNSSRLAEINYIISKKYSLQYFKNRIRSSLRGMKAEGSFSADH